jgi:DNA mismatch repair ATPase MutS
MIIDEIFTATSPEQAEKLAYDFLKQLCSYENCVFIDATHYAKLTELEKETNGACKNYQVEAITDANGKVIKYTYRIIEGISEVKNAAQVAQEENIFNSRF